MLKPQGNVFIMYPCAPLEEAFASSKDKPSLFTGHLLKYLQSPEDVVHIFRRTAYDVLHDPRTVSAAQHPWYEESMKAQGESVMFQF